MKLNAVEDDGTFFTEGGAAETASVAGVHGLEGKAEVIDAGEALGEVVVDDEEIDQRQELFYAGVEVIEISRDEDAGGASPAGGEGRGGGIVAIEVQDLGVFAPGRWRSSGWRSMRSSLRQSTVRSPAESTMMRLWALTPLGTVTIWVWTPTRAKASRWRRAASSSPSLPM